jgi:replicative DNA helicase
VNHDHEAERMVIAAVVHSGDLRCWQQAHAALAPECFHLPAHRRIWEACGRAARANPSALSPQLVAGELGADHADAFLEATGRISIPRTLPDYIRRVRDLATLREVGRVCGEIYAKSREGVEDIQDFLDDAPRQIAEAMRGRMLSVPGHDIRDVVESVYLDAAKMLETGGTLGHSTGLRALDAATLGLIDSDLIVIAGRPGMGKSALAQHMICSVAAQGKRALVFSLEMPKEQWTQRMLAAEGKLGLRNVRTAKALRESPAEYVAACERVSRLPVRLVDIAGMNAATLTASARAYAQDAGKLGLIVIDYLQLMIGDKRIPREQQVSESSRACKLLARELECPVVLLSQLNREVEKRGDGRPQLSDLRESGSIEQDADMILFVNRPGERDPDNEDLKGFAELILGKCRNGATGTVHAAWIGEHTLFGDLPMGWKPPEARTQVPRRRAGSYQ